MRAEVAIPDAQLAVVLAGSAPGGPGSHSSEPRRIVQRNVGASDAASRVSISLVASCKLFGSRDDSAEVVGTLSSNPPNPGASFDLFSMRQEVTPDLAHAPCTAQCVGSRPVLVKFGSSDDRERSHDSLHDRTSQ